VVVVIGPSGGGKSSVLRALYAEGLVSVHPTWTTRPPRPDERHGCLEHRFVAQHSFDSLCLRGFFIGTATPFGLPYRYGLPPLRRAAGGPADVVALRAVLAAGWTEQIGPVVVYQIEADPERASERLRRRGCGDHETSARLADNLLEVEAGRQVADRVFVNDGSLPDLVDSVIRALRCDVPSAVAVA
jgi:guanylate kinase